MSTTKTCLICAVSLFLVACGAVAPTRDTAGAFVLRQKGVVPQSQVFRFVECAADQFKQVKPSFFVYHTVVQERRMSGYRVEFKESIGAGTVLVSVDVADDGNYEVHETTHVYVGVQPVREEALSLFANCKNKFDLKT